MSDILSEIYQPIVAHNISKGREIMKKIMALLYLCFFFSFLVVHLRTTNPITTVQMMQGLSLWNRLMTAVISCLAAITAVLSCQKR